MHSAILAAIGSPPLVCDGRRFPHSNSRELTDDVPLQAREPATFGLVRTTRVFLAGVSDSMGRRLYVGNLPYSTTEDQLTELFSRAGKVDNVRVMRDMATGRSRGFAFVEMSTDEEAQKAIADLNAHEMGGRGLTVNEARPKPAYSGGGGGGYGGGDSGRRRSEPRW